MKAYKDAIDAAIRKYLVPLGPGRIYLYMLVTHPDYRHRGAATALCEWGMDKAKEHNMCVALMGSPMGSPLYRHLGFQELGTVTVQVMGEEEKLTKRVFVYWPKKGDGLSAELGAVSGTYGSAENTSG
jgi:GNAT superfamily N-acetyltransferase